MEKNKIYFFLLVSIIYMESIIIIWVAIQLYIPIKVYISTICPVFIQMCQLLKMLVETIKNLTPENRVMLKF